MRRHANQGISNDDTWYVGELLILILPKEEEILTHNNDQCEQVKVEYAKDFPALFSFKQISHLPLHTATHAGYSGITC